MSWSAILPPRRDRSMTVADLKKHLREKEDGLEVELSGTAAMSRTALLAAAEQYNAKHGSQLIASGYTVTATATDKVDVWVDHSNAVLAQAIDKLDAIHHKETMRHPVEPGQLWPFRKRDAQSA